MRPKSLKYYLPFLLLSLLSFRSAAQRGVAENLETFLYRPYYFGFVVGFNSMNFMVHPAKAYYPNDSLYTITARPEYGVHFGILANKRIGNHLHGRLSTVLAFGSRALDYRIKYLDSFYVNTKMVESTFLEFPLSLKYTSRRVGNFSAYVLGGAKYGIDLASQADKKEQTEDLIIKLKKNDFTMEMGVGVDFYLPFFKFGIELKRAFGVSDLLVREQNIFTSDIKKVNSKIYQLSFTFEG